jgi:hypothetical protein
MKRVRLSDDKPKSRSSDQGSARKRSTGGAAQDSKAAARPSDRASSAAASSQSSRTPREKGRWPKGVSGNRAGRSKGSKNKRTVIIEMMEAKLGRKIPDPKKLTRYEGMMFKAIQKALGGEIRSMGFVLTEYRKAIESSVSMTAAATTEEDQEAYDAMREKIRREIEDEVRAAVRSEIRRELIQKNQWR